MRILCEIKLHSAGHGICVKKVAVSCDSDRSWSFGRSLSAIDDKAREEGFAADSRDSGVEKVKMKSCRWISSICSIRNELNTFNRLHFHPNCFITWWYRKKYIKTFVQLLNYCDYLAPSCSTCIQDSLSTAIHPHRQDVRLCRILSSKLAPSFSAHRAQMEVHRDWIVDEASLWRWRHSTLSLERGQVDDAWRYWRHRAIDDESRSKCCSSLSWPYRHRLRTLVERPWILSVFVKFKLDFKRICTSFSPVFHRSCPLSCRRKVQLRRSSRVQQDLIFQIHLISRKLISSNPLLTYPPESGGITASSSLFFNTRGPASM